MHKRLAIVVLFVLVFVSGVALAKPRIDLLQAVDLAQAYVVQHHIPNHDRHLLSVTWQQNRKHPEKSYWAVYWAPNDSGILDGQLVVLVYDNGTIEHQGSGA